MNDTSSIPSSAKRPHIFYAGLLVLLTLWMSLPGLFSMPVIDRDESRYAQATIQMVESGDYINIRFQDEARNKKPIGIYWMQAGSVKAFTDPGERKIWAHRIPSVLGALIAVLATYWGGILVFGRRGAFMGAAVLATTALVVFEAHIAKTDAMLCAMSAIVLATLLRLRSTSDAKLAILFWGALAVGIMIKGPILPGIVFFTLLSLFVWEREAVWMRRLVSWPGIILALVIVLPWTIMITLATDGAFLREAIGGDLAPKLMGAQEKHGGLPGYYISTLPVLFWPGSLFLIAGITFGVQAVRKTNEENSQLGGAVRLLFAWIVPFWIVLEIVPTKLPNYLLPIYPALALLCGGVIMALLSFQAFPKSRRIGALMFLIISVLLVTFVLSGEALYAEVQYVWLFVVAIICVALAFVVVWALWSSRTQLALVCAGVSTLVLTPMVYQFIMPRLDTLYVAHRIEKSFLDNNISLPRVSGVNTPQVLSPTFTEPSLVYRLGQDIRLGHEVDNILKNKFDLGDILLFDTNRKADVETLSLIRLGLQSRVDKNEVAAPLCLDKVDQVKGVNYSKGDTMKIDILQAVQCATEDVNAPSDPLETPEM